MGNVAGIGVGSIGQRSACCGDGLLVAQAGEQARFRRGSARGESHDPVPQLGDTFSRKRLGRQRRDLRRLCRGQVKSNVIFNGKIALIDGDNCGAAFNGGEQFVFFVVERLGRVEHN